MNKITINLWFDNQAEEAAAFYTTIFKESSFGRVTRYGEGGFDIHGMPAGTVMTVEFTLGELHFVALNGGPHFKFNESISLIVHCETQGDIDYYWSKLSEGGDPDAQQCGWLKDKFGLSWQIVPALLSEMLNDPDPLKSQRVMGALLPMKKLDIGKLEQAFEGE